MEKKIFTVKDYNDTFKEKYNLFIFNSKHEIFISNFIDDLANAGYDVVKLTNKNFIKQEVLNLRYFQLLSAKSKCLVIREDIISKKSLEFILSEITNFNYDNTLVLVNKDYKTKAKFRKMNALINNDKVCWLDFDFPSRQFISQFIEMYLHENNRRIDCKSTLKVLTSRLSDKYDEYYSNLNNLIDISENVITKEMVLEAVEDYSNYSFRIFFESLVMLNRKTVPIKSLDDLLNERTPISVLNNLATFFEYLYQAKYLKIRGVLMKGDFIDRQREYFYIRKDLKLPKNKSIFRQSKSRINFYLGLVDFITVDEIVKITTMINACWRVSTTGQKYVLREDIYSLVLKIISRREMVDELEEELDV